MVTKIDKVLFSFVLISAHFTLYSVSLALALPILAWHRTSPLSVSALSLAGVAAVRRRRGFFFNSDFDARRSGMARGAIAVMNFEEFIEKDWSVLDSDKSTSEREFNKPIDHIISAGKIDETSRVLVAIGSEEFVDRLVDSSPSKFLLVVHDSILILAGIKEKYDQVKCWQGEIIYVPEKWAPFDVIFLYFLPALPFKLDDILGSLAKKCSPGGRVVMSHPQGRKVLEQQRQQHPEVVVSDLPDKTTLQRVAAAHSFDLAEFVDEPGLYLAVLSWSGA
ncbi:Kynurenine formamidase [Senna tora]|uniref:Kynurenine formamidase n=1 Tax=Senna tora TaxID=362788 RepID=A0A834SZ16_9FABA|nr:Kynurenine formamidase [Senna tora]